MRRKSFRVPPISEIAVSTRGFAFKVVSRLIISFIFDNGTLINSRGAGGAPPIIVASIPRRI